MRIDSMIQREDFFSILSETAEEYYQKVHGKKITFTYEKGPGLEPLVINDKFSFVCRAKTPRGLKKFLLAEYNIRGSKLKYLLGKLLVHAVCAFPALGKCKTAFLTKGILGRNTFVSPQNRSIRFFDYDSMTVDCIVKQGFSRRYFENQITFRKTHSYSFMIPLMESGDNWFREPILNGHALARTTDSRLYSKGISDTLHALAQLAQDTYVDQDTDKYLDSVVQKLEALLAKAEKRKKLDCLPELRTIIEHAVAVIREKLSVIPTVMSHGDLQGGNIWIDKEGNTFLYDWETADRRSVWYDSAVLNYSLRRAYGWGKFINAADIDDVLFCDKQKNRYPDELHAIKNMILLEDIMFYLEDMNEFPEDWGSEIFNGYMKCIIEALNGELCIP